MKSINQKAAFIPKIYCNIFGHDFKVSRHVTHHVKEYQCRTCKTQATTNGNGKLTTLTPKYKKINNSLELMYKRKTKRLATGKDLESGLRITA